MEILKDLFLYLRDRKKYWLAPVIVALLILGILVIFSAGSPLAPFIYSLF